MQEIVRLCVGGGGFGSSGSESCLQAALATYKSLRENQFPFDRPPSSTVVPGLRPCPHVGITAGSSPPPMHRLPNESWIADLSLRALGGYITNGDVSSTIYFAVVSHFFPKPLHLQRECLKWERSDETSRRHECIKTGIQCSLGDGARVIIQFYEYEQCDGRRSLGPLEDFLAQFCKTNTSSGSDLKSRAREEER